MCSMTPSNSGMGWYGIILTNASERGLLRLYSMSEEAPYHSKGAWTAYSRSCSFRDRMSGSQQQERVDMTMVPKQAMRTGLL